MDITNLVRAVSYDPSTGELLWLRKTGSSREVSRWNARYAGRPAFACISDRGYLTGTFDGRHIKAHRAAWAIFHGKWPTMEIDHANGDPKDNRISNLREATRTQNAQNVPKRKGGVSVYRGVSQAGSRWRAKINANGIRTSLGSYQSEEDAAIAYDLASVLMHGDFARPNIVRDPDAMTRFIEEYVRAHYKQQPIVGVRTWQEKEAY